jgi:hypothetical protein
MSKPDAIPAAVRELATRSAEPQPMRRGSLSELSMKCGQPAVVASATPKRGMGRTSV